MTKHAVLGLAILVVIGCSPMAESTNGVVSPRAGVETKQKGDRLLGLGVTEGSIGYEAAFGKAKMAGIQFIELPQQWDEIETELGKYNSPFLKMANDVYPALDTSLVLSINPIDTTALRVAKPFAGEPFDDPEFIAAFIKLVDFVIDGVPDANIVCIAIGNEVDGYLGNDQYKWQAYKKFFKDVRAHVKRRLPDIPVGVKMTWNASTKTNTTEIASINNIADAVMVTYYPLDDDFTVRSPSSVSYEIDQLIEAAHGKPVFLLETGYPSAKGSNSSQQKQSEFIDQLFAAWDKHAEAMPIVNFVWLCDMSSNEVKAMSQYYSVASPEFVSFLGSLGLLTNDGKHKPAFDRLQEHAKSRGW